MGEIINSFENGMTSDASPLYQPQGTYPYMKNCSLVSQDGNNYAVKDCLGNTLVFSINIPYNAIYTVLGTPPMPIAFVSFPGELYVYSTNSESLSGGPGAIGRIKYLPYGEGVQPLSETGQMNVGYNPIYYHNNLLFSKQYKIKAVAFPESDSKKRIYWTDNFNSMRVINTSDSIYTTTFSSGALVAGTQYMVVEGAIQHPVGGANPIYGPGITAGNVFTAVSATYTSLTGSSPTPKIIEYYPIELLDFTPDRSIGDIQFSEYGTGNVMCGNKVYYVRLSLTDGSFATSWSYGSSPIPVGTTNTGFTVSNNYKDFSGGGTSTILLNSSRSVKVQVTGIDSNYGFIELACAEYDYSISSPRQITVVSKQEITGSTMIIEHSGTTNLSNLTLDDLTINPASIITCKSLATNKNYLLAAHTTERTEFDLSYMQSAVTITSFEYPMPLAWNFLHCDSGYSYTPFVPTCGANPARIAPFTRYMVTGSGTVTYNAVVYTTGTTNNVFIGVTGTYTYTTTGAPTIRPCVTQNRYTKTTDGTRTENAIEITGDTNVGFWDYKEPTVAHHCLSYWSGEKYRLGIQLWDKKGKPYYPQYLGDYTMPIINTKSGLTRFDNYNDGVSTNPLMSLNPSGIKLSEIFLPDSILDEISGFSIVRAERIPRIVTQGIVSQVTTDGTNFTPGAYIPVVRDQRGVATQYYIYICPDNLVGVPLKTTIGQVGDMMEEAAWLTPGATVHWSSGAVNNRLPVARIVTHQANSNLRNGTITSWAETNENESASIPTPGGTFNNNMQVGAGSTTPSCNAINNDGMSAVGGKKIVFTLDADFAHYGTANGYTSVAANANTSRILMNYVNPAGGNYGDPSDTVWISTGHFQPINSTVRTEADFAGGCKFNDVEIFGGDCYTNMIDYGYGLYSEPLNPSYSYAWYFPCECNSNYNLRRGRKVMANGMYDFVTAESNDVVYTSPTSRVALEGLSYNQGYSSEGQAVKYPGLQANYVADSVFRNRIRFAGVKIIGETTDSFRKFLINDYHDTDVQGGQINEIAVKAGRVIVWQNKMTGTVPVLERQLLSGLSGSATTLGTGGVIDRFDPINSYYGTQHQWSVIETEFGFVWFDMRRKAFMVFDAGIANMSEVLGEKQFFNEAFVEAVGNNIAIINSTEPILNSPNWDDYSDRPLMGIGITGVYDSKFSMTYMTFKFMRKIYDPFTTNLNYVSQDFTIAYYHPKKQFQYFSDWTPAIAHNHNGILLSANNPKNLNKYHGPSMATVTFVVGDIMKYETSEYVCTANREVTAYGGPNLSFFAKINTVNEIWVTNQPTTLNQTTAPDYIYNMIFGRVVNNTLSIIINPKTNLPFTVYNIQQQGNSVNYTTIETENETQTAADSNIRATDRNYEYDFDHWESNLPMSDTGRLVGKWIKITFTKKNWTTDPRTLTKSVKILNYIKSFFRERF